MLRLFFPQPAKDNSVWNVIRQKQAGINARTGSEQTGKAIWQ